MSDVWERAWVAVDKDGTENIFSNPPIRGSVRGFPVGRWVDEAPPPEVVTLPRGTIERLLGHTMTWEDEAKELVYD